jgi:hypothetical protein
VFLPVLSNMGNIFGCRNSNLIKETNSDSSSTTEEELKLDVITTINNGKNASTMRKETFINCLCDDTLCYIFFYLSVKDVGSAIFTQIRWTLPGKQRLPSIGESLRIPQDISTVRVGVSVYSRYFRQHQWKNIFIGPGLHYLEKKKIGSRFDVVENINPFSGCRPIYRRQMTISKSGIKIVGTLDPNTNRPITQLEGQLRIKEGKNINISGIRVRCPTSNGFIVEKCGAAFLENCDALNCGQNGLSVTSGGRAEAKNCVFNSNLYDGISILNPGTWYAIVVYYLLV